MFNYQNLESGQFEELCRDIMEVKTGIPLRVFAKGTDGGIDLTDDPVRKRIVVQVKHYEKSRFSDLRHSLEKEADRIEKIKPQKYYICVSKSLTPDNVNTIYQMFSDYMESSSNVVTINDIDVFLHDRNNLKITSKHTKLWLESGISWRLLAKNFPELQKMLFFCYFNTAINAVTLIAILICMCVLIISFRGTTNNKIFSVNESDIPEVYCSFLAEYTEVSAYTKIKDMPSVGISNESLQEFSNAFSIVSHIKNPYEDKVKADKIMTTITEVQLDDKLDIGANAVIYKGQLEIFLINNSWGSSDKVTAELFYIDEEREKPYTAFSKQIYENTVMQLAPGDIVKVATFRLDRETFLTGINRNDDNRTHIVGPSLRCRINDGMSEYEKSMGWIGYDEEKGGFYIGRGGGDKPEGDYTLLFLKLDVEDLIRDGLPCSYRYNTSNAYPVIEDFITIDTAIAPTQSCYLKCFNTFEICGHESRTEEFWTHVDVPYYVDGTIDAFSSLSPKLAEADERGIDDLKSVATDYVYEADSLMPHGSSNSEPIDDVQ